MSLENDNGNSGSADKVLDGFDETQRSSKISYSREFLLSLSELEFCKKLPNGFDRSVLSEFEDASLGQDRPRSHGSLPLQGFRRNDYSSSPPTRGDTGNNSRGVYGRWDNRSSGWNNKESDSQSDIDSESGRRYGNQSLRPSQNSEHDGLLGSGSFPRPSGFSAGASGPKVQANDHYQLKRSTEPYHPPRPFQAVPHARSNVTDSLNDETFGSSEARNQDRAEEERRRRASFELMRKEQQKVLQEKQKVNTNKQKSDGLSDLTVLLEEPKEDKGLLEMNNEVDSGISSASNNDSGKSQGLTSRPLVPPGFRSTILDKSSGAKLLTSFPEKEVVKPEVEEIRLQAKDKPIQNGTLGNRGDRQSTTELDLSEKLLEDNNIQIPNLKWGVDTTNTSKLVVPTQKPPLNNHLYKIAGLSEVNETVDDGEVIALMTKKLIGDKNINSTKESSTSLLEKLFGGASSENTSSSSGLIERHDSKPDEIWNPSNSLSSKFAQWFDEDEKKLRDDLSSGRPNDLLSLIVGAEKIGSQVSTPKTTELNFPEVSYESSEITNRITASIPSAATETSEQLYKGNKDIFPSTISSAPVVLTCEDLEQTILSEYSEKSSILEPVVLDWTIAAPDAPQMKAVDSSASHHLLSLLQKGTSVEANLDTGSLEKPLVSEGGLYDKPKSNAENIHNSGQSLTLETLFGTAFMKELQSVDAPVSVQRGSSSLTRTDVIEPHGLSNDGPFPSTIDVASNMRIHESNFLGSNKIQPTKSDKIQNFWSQFDDPRMEADTIQLQTEVAPRHTGFDGTVEFKLPEEESLITLGDRMNPQKSMFRNSSTGEFLPSNGPIDIAEKLAALKSGFRGERSMMAQEGHPFSRGPFDLMEPERQYQNLHAQPSPPHIHGPQMSLHQRTLFHPSDPHPGHINSQMRFPEHVGQRDTPPGQQFPANMLRPPFHHPDTRVTGFDLPSHQQMLQQMQMAGNFPPPHLLRDFPRGSPMPPHPSHQATNFMQEPDTLQGFPLNHRQPNIGRTGMPMPAPDTGSGSNHPEAFQRLMEMELRAKSKQAHPFGNAHELDMGFRYR